MPQYVRRGDGMMRSAGAMRDERKGSKTVLEKFISNMLYML